MSRNEQTQDERGVLFPNDDKQKDTHPDVRGRGKIDGRWYWISGWDGESKKGVQYTNLSFQEMAPEDADRYEEDGGGGGRSRGRGRSSGGGGGRGRSGGRSGGGSRSRSDDSDEPRYGYRSRGRGDDRSDRGDDRDERRASGRERERDDRRDDDLNDEVPF